MTRAKQLVDILWECECDIRGDLNKIMNYVQKLHAYYENEEGTELSCKEAERLEHALDMGYDDFCDALCEI